MKLNRQNTKKRRPNNFPEVRRNKGFIKNSYGKLPKKKQLDKAKIGKAKRRRKQLQKPIRYTRFQKNRIKIALVILLAILTLLLGLIMR